MAKNNEILYPFGESLFIGIVKFFDSSKGFGYIASNNYGMESHKRFNSSEQGFYIDNSSWEQSVPEKKAVVFRPAIKDGKLRAEDVRAVNLATDREIVMNYYEHNNFIQYEEKVKRFSTGRYGRTHFEGYSHERRKFNILMKSGISRYELLNEYATSFAETNDFDYLIKKIDKIVETIDGDNAYNKQLRGSYGNKENEHAAWKNIFGLLNEDQIYKLLAIHPSLQLFAPDELLLKRINEIDSKWGVSIVVRKALIALEEAKKLKKIEELIDSNLPEKSRKEIEDIREIYSSKISSERLDIINKCIDELTLSKISELISELSSENTREFIKQGKSLSNEFAHLSDTGKLQFKQGFGTIYEQKITNLVKNISTLDWNNYQKIEVKDFLLSDEIIVTEQYSLPISALKAAVIKDYEILFIQPDNTENLFGKHYELDNEYSQLFEDKEHEIFMQEIEKKCLETGGLFSIVRLFSFLNKKLPDNTKERFLDLPLEKIVSNITVMKMFEDCGRSIIKNIVDHICETDKFFFHKEKGDNEDYLFLDTHPNNLKFANDLVAICGADPVEKEFVRLKPEDRLDLYIEMQLNIISSDELKNYLLATPNANYQNVLSTPIGKDAIVSIIMDADCSKTTGIYNASLWLGRYIGEEPIDYYERSDWYKKRKGIIDSIVSSNNEYLKILTWALYFQSGGKISLLKDVFHLYPTTLQIRVVKKFFNAMSLKKFTPSLETLRNTLGGDIHKLSLPVEIVFKYLTLKKDTPDSHMTDAIMLSIFQGREDYGDWFMINQMLNPCNGRLYMSYDNKGIDDSYRNFHGTIKEVVVAGQNVYRVLLSKKQITANETVTQYNNKQFDTIKDYISICFSQNSYKIYQSGENHIYDFNLSEERELRIMAEAYRLKMGDVNYIYHYELDEGAERFCCECRVSDNLDRNANKVFLWCRNRPCFHKAPHFHSNYEWENYTVLDFMRILSIPTDYTNQKGKVSRHGQYLIFSTYMLSFHEFLEHLKCRKCGKLMEPCDISNFARSSLTEFACTNPECELHGHTVYLNKCFNSKCNSVIDSRDSKQCPNGSYICEKCGACCSNRKYEERYNRLQMTGGYVSQWLLDAIHHQIGHWEKGELYCSSCGNKIEGDRCSCGKTYDLKHGFNM